MDKGITERRLEITQKDTKQSPSSDHLKAIVVILVKLAERRQAQVNSSTLVTFAEDLGHYTLFDVDAACKELGQRRRYEGETAFPDIATILEGVRSGIRARRPSVEQAAQQRWDEYVSKCLQEGVEPPDEETQKRIEALNAKLSLKVAM